MLNVLVGLVFVAIGSYQFWRTKKSFKELQSGEVKTSSAFIAYAYYFSYVLAVGFILIGISSIIHH